MNENTVEQLVARIAELEAELGIVQPKLKQRAPRWLRMQQVWEYLKDNAGNVVSVEELQRAAHVDGYEDIAPAYAGHLALACRDVSRQGEVSGWAPKAERWRVVFLHNDLDHQSNCTPATCFVYLDDDTIDQWLVKGVAR